MSDNNVQHRNFEFNDPRYELKEIVKDEKLNEADIKDCLYEYDNLFNDSVGKIQFTESYKNYIKGCIPLKKIDFVLALTQQLNNKLNKRLKDSIGQFNTDFYKIYNDLKYKEEDLLDKFKVMPDSNFIPVDTSCDEGNVSYFINKMYKTIYNNESYSTYEVLLKRIRDGSFDYKIEDDQIFEYLKDPKHDSLYTNGISYFFLSFFTVSNIIKKYNPQYLNDTTINNKIKNLAFTEIIDFLVKRYPEITVADKKSIDSIRLILLGRELPPDILKEIAQDSALTLQKFDSFQKNLSDLQLETLRFSKLVYHLSAINKKYKDYIFKKILKEESINRRHENFKKAINDKKWQFIALAEIGMQLSFYKQTKPEHMSYDFQKVMKEINDSNLPLSFKIYISHYLKLYVDDVDFDK